MPRPEVTVAIPSHDRLRRLSRLLDGLQDQTLAADRFEVVVCHDSDDGSDELLQDHGLTEAGVLRHLRVSRDEGSPASQRNRAWRAGSAPLVAFMDDDCRPSPRWLEALLEVARDAPGAIVQGATRPDPEEVEALRLPYARSIEVQPPSSWAESCNIAYPRPLLESLEGFSEEFPCAAGEDTDLMLRAVAAGASYVAAPDALVWHAVEGGSLVARLRSLPRWQHGPLVLRRHPGMRAQLPLRFFWKPSHVRLLPALAGLVLAVATRRPWALALLLPWLRMRGHWYGIGPTSVARSAHVTAGELLIDTTELAVVLRGSVRYRTLLL